MLILFARWLFPHLVLLYNVTVTRSWQPYARGYRTLLCKVSVLFRLLAMYYYISNRNNLTLFIFLSLFLSPLVFLNFVGFCAFWLPPPCGEHMGLSITAMLAALASEIVIAAKLPAAKEMTWFSKFSIMSLSFTFISLLGKFHAMQTYPQPVLPPPNPNLCLICNIPCNLLFLSQRAYWFYIFTTRGAKI